uniref:NACHT domain-containing protein n=1 Tax=Panagrolaimus superbus TaxID=310955 RepID=A0A914ZHJ7_9BILA
MEYSDAKNGQIEKYVSKSFGSTANLLIIVDKESKKDVNQFCKIINQVLCKHSEKKIVIIGNENSPTASALKTAPTQVPYDIYLDKCNFNDLTPNSQLNIQKNTTVTFQGSNASLCDLIDSNDSASELIDSETLLKMVMGEKIIIGDPIKNFTDTEEQYYHQRKFRLIEIDCKVFKETLLKQNHLFFIEGIKVLKYLKKNGIKKSEIKDYKNSSADCRFIIVKADDSKLQYGSVCENHPNSYIYWLKLVNKRLIWFHSYIPPSACLTQEFVKHIKQNDTYVDESFFYEYVKQNNIVIITDIAGMGKTTVLKSFSKTLDDTTYWKIRINLNQYTDTLMEIKKYIKKHNITVETLFKEISELQLNFAFFDGKDYGKLVLKSLINNQKPDVGKLTFEDRIFNHFFTKNKMLLMFDGFDEINPDYGDEVMALLQKLKKDEKNRIWITSRTNFKEMLENKLNTFAYDLKPFDEEDQEIFLTKFWLNNWKMEKGNDMPNQDRLSLYITELLEEASEIIGDIIGIPLQTKIKTWKYIFALRTLF